MFGFKRSKKESQSTEPAVKTGIFTKLKNGLRKTRAQFTKGVAALVFGKKVIDATLLAELETQLLIADVGIEASEAIIADLTQRVHRKQLADGEALFAALKENLQAILQPCEVPLELNSSDSPTVILVVGVNGSGKTTTIGKLAKKLQAEGNSVMLAAGDTFRAAAVEQLQIWGERNNIAVVAQPGGRDSASVVYDAMQSAMAKGIDVVIADTAGRLHTQVNLMAELQKVVRVMQKLDPKAPHEVLLVLDAGTGQNALNQAKQFHSAVNVSGLTITKLDGTAKGGIVFAIAKDLKLPIRFIGVGEAIDDLRPFEVEPFVDALLNHEAHQGAHDEQEP